MAIENTTTVKSVTSGTQLSSVGTVKTVVGLVKAVDTNGVERVLQVGDKVYANETIFTSADGAVIVEFQNGSYLDLPRSAHIVLDPEIYSAGGQKSIEQEAQDEAARIARAIAEGRDPNAEVGATAAGGNVGDEGSSTPLVIDFNNTQGNVTSGFPTGPISLSFPPPQEELPPTEPVATVAPENFLPSAGNIQIAVDEDDISFQEQAAPGWLAAFEIANGADASFFNAPGNSDLELAAGDDLPDPSPTIISGLLNIDFGGDGAGDIKFDIAQDLTFNSLPIESGGEALQYWVSADGHTLVGYITVTEFNGESASTFNKIIFSAEITDPATGAYTYTQYGVLDHSGLNVEDNILITLSFTVNDSNGDEANGTLSIDVDDDVPVGNQNSLPAYAVQEDALLGGNPEGDSQTTTQTILGTDVASLVDAGADAPVAISLNLALLGEDGSLEGIDTGLNQTTDGVAYDIVWHVNEITGALEGIVDGGANDGGIVFTITVSGDDFVFELKDNIDHAVAPAGDDDTETLSLDGVFIATDTDGDAVAVAGGITVTIENDVPITTGVNLVFDETLSEIKAASGEVDVASVLAYVNLAHIAGGFDLDALNAAQGTVTGASTGGADGFVKFAFDMESGTSSGLTTSITDLQITWVQVSDSLILGVTGYNSSDSTYTGVALSLHMDEATGLFTVIQYQALTNPIGGTSYDELLSSAVSIDYVVIDGDGDKTSGAATFNFNDDGLLANTDIITASAVGSVTGNLLTNDVAGVDGINVTSITVDGVVHNLVNGTVTVTVATHRVTGGGPPVTYEDTLTVNSDGSYTYTITYYDANTVIPPVSYTIMDGDGDISTASLEFQLVNTAFLVANTNNPGGGSTVADEQTVNVFITNDDVTLSKSVTVGDQEGQQDLPLVFDQDVVFAPNSSYTVVVDHVSGAGHTNITEFTLYDKNGDGVVLNEPNNGNDNTSLSADGASSNATYDGVIYDLNVDGAGVVNASDAIGYDLGSKSGGDILDDGTVLILDSANSNNTSFSLDFSDLPINGVDDLFGVVKTIDISGSGTNEDNTILLTAQDVLDLGDGGDYTLFVTGDVGDTVDLTGFAPAPVPVVTVDGVDYNSYQTTISGHMVTLNIEQEVSVT